MLVFIGMMQSLIRFVLSPASLAQQLLFCINCSVSGLGFYPGVELKRWDQSLDRRTSRFLLLPREAVGWPWWKNQRKVHWWRSPCWLLVGPWPLIIFMRATPETVWLPSSWLGSLGFRFSESFYGFSPTSTLFSKPWGSLRAGHPNLKIGHFSLMNGPP